MLGLAASCIFPGGGIWIFAESCLASMEASHVFGCLDDVGGEDLSSLDAT
jgi:hypothetical protein